MGPPSAVEFVVTLVGTTLVSSTLLGMATVTSTVEGASLFPASTSSFQQDFFYTNTNTKDIFITAHINITYRDENNVLRSEFGNTDIAKYGEGMVGSAMGQLIHVQSSPSSSSPYPPESACTGPLVPVRSSLTIPVGPWIALIRRGDCNFETKVRHAFHSHASAVIIYNNLDTESLDKMKLGDVGNITAVFTYKDKGEKMAHLVDNGTNVIAAISVGSRCSRSPHPINRIFSTCYLDELFGGMRGGVPLSHAGGTSVLFVSISFIVLMVFSLAWLVFYYVQRFRYIHAKDRLSRRLCTAAKKALSKIPTKNIKADDKEVIGDGESCPVCIDPYKVLDVVRILPCWHEFHKSCIDPWLLDHRTCPMCKMDILRYYGFVLTGSQESILQFHADEVASLSLPQLRRVSLHVALPPESTTRATEQPTSSVASTGNASSHECPAL